MTLIDLTKNDKVIAIFVIVILVAFSFSILTNPAITSYTAYDGDSFNAGFSILLNIVVLSLLLFFVFLGFKLIRRKK